MTIEFTGDDVKSARDVSGVTGDSIGQNTGTIKHGYSYGNADSGLIGYWPFDGSYTDESPYSNDGTANATSFDGTNQVGTNSVFIDSSYVQVPGNEPIVFNADSTFTIATWVYPNTIGSTTSILTSRVDNENYFHFFAQGTTDLRISLHGDSEALLISNRDIAENEWTHLAATYEGSINKLTYYEDGQEIISVNRTGSSFQGTFVPANWYFGSIQGGTWALDGYLDDVRMYGRKLSQPEIEALANLTNTSTLTPEDTLQ